LAFTDSFKHVLLILILVEAEDSRIVLTRVAFQLVVGLKGISDGPTPSHEYAALLLGWRQKVSFVLSVSRHVAVVIGLLEGVPYHHLAVLLSHSLLINYFYLANVLYSFQF